MSINRCLGEENLVEEAGGKAQCVKAIATKSDDMTWILESTEQKAGSDS